MGKWHTLARWSLFLVLLLLLAGWRWAIVSPATHAVLPGNQIASGATPVEAEYLSSSPIISDVTITFYSSREFIAPSIESAHITHPIKSSL